MLNTIFLKFPQNLNYVKSDKIQGKMPCDQVILHQVKSSLPKYKSDNISFTSCNDISKITDINGVERAYNNYTIFFRDFHLLEFLKSYININFSKGTSILDFGCSTGKETRTIAMILDNAKHKIIGFDIVKKVVDIAKKGEYQIRLSQDGNVLDEHFLNKNISIHRLREPNDKALLEGYWSKFDEFFDTREEKSIISSTSDCFVPEKIYKAKNEKFNNMIIGFKVGDISNINKAELKRLNPGVVVFKNAWYHLSTEGDMKKIDAVVKNIHDILPQNGLLVCGSLSDDHVINYKGQIGSISDNLPFHKILKEAGFQPIFYEPGGFRQGQYFKVPSVWKKV